MKIALECPTYLLKDIQPLADFDWILTHLVLEDPEYAEWYRKSTNFKVLDNSVNELLKPCTLDDMLEAALRVGGIDMIVPPDFLGDAEKTRSSLVEALSLWALDAVLPVVQGGSLEEILRCTSDYLDLGFGRLAVPYDLLCKRTAPREEMAKARQRIVSGIINLAPIGLKIHLLGFTTLEELAMHNRGWVKSIDTGVPILYGLNEKHLDGPWEFKKDKPTMSQMEKASAGYLNDKLSAVFYNIAYLRKVISG